MSPFAVEELVQNLMDQGEWRKGVCLQPVPRLKKGISACRHWIVKWGEINQQAIIHGRGEEVHCCRPSRQRPGSGSILTLGPDGDNSTSR